MKYDIDFKLRVIAYYQQGHSGMATAKHFGINKKDVYKWVNQYQIGKVLAIRPKTSKAVYSSDFKHHVITTMAADGLSLSQAALKFNISSPALLSVWRKSYTQHGMIGLTAKAKGRPTMSNPYIVNKPDDEKTTEELKRENEYLRAENAYLKKLDALLQEKEATKTKQGSSKK